MYKHRHWYPSRKRIPIETDIYPDTMKFETQGNGYGEHRRGTRLGDVEDNGERAEGTKKYGREV